MEKALYFMPDISGFTNFVNSTELNHSIHIVAELLETLLDNNVLNLKLVEIEGDALFMFTTEIPSYTELISQIEIMFAAFHTQTKLFESQRICNCGSCKTTVNLGVKFLVHYGDLNYIQVKNIKKPYGSDVIKIHRLLKNKVEGNNYFLLTDDVLNFYKSDIKDKLENEIQYYDNQELNYFFKKLNSQINDIKIFNSTPNNILQFAQPTLSINRVFNSNNETIYGYLSDLKYRQLWDIDAKKVKYDSQKINRIGTEHNCVLDIGNIKFETIAKPSEDILKYGEQTQNLIFTDYFAFIIYLNKINENETQVKLDIFIQFTILGKIMKESILKRIEKNWKSKLIQLDKLSKTPIK